MIHLIFNYNGKFTNKLKQLASQGRKAVFSFRRSYKNFKVNVESELYLDKYILAILNYDYL